MVLFNFFFAFAIFADYNLRREKKFLNNLLLLLLNNRLELFQAEAGSNIFIFTNRKNGGDIKQMGPSFKKYIAAL